MTSRFYDNIIKELGQLDEEYEKWYDKCQDMENDLRNRDKTISELEEENDSLKEEVEKLKDDIENFKRILDIWEGPN